MKREKKSKKSKSQRKSPKNPKEIKEIKNERKLFVPDKNYLADIHIKNRSSRIKTLL